MKQLSITALQAMKPKIRQALRLSLLGKGEEMNGHRHTCYIANRFGHNVMRVSYDVKTRTHIVYGQESVNITNNVKAMLGAAK